MTVPDTQKATVEDWGAVFLAAAQVLALDMEGDFLEEDRARDLMLDCTVSVC